MNLQPILHQFELNVDTTRIERWYGAGFSGTQIWRVSTQDLGCFCLRADPISHQDFQRLAWRAQLLQSLALPFLLVPRWSRDQLPWVQAFGHVWQMEPWARGCNDFHPDRSWERLESVMRALAELHSTGSTLNEPLGMDLPTESVTSPGLRRRYEFLLRWRAQQSEAWPRIDQRIRSLPERRTWQHLVTEIRQRFLEAEANMGRELEKAMGHPFPPSVVLGDPWSDHLFFEHDQLAHVIDYDAMRIDHVSTDLSRCLTSLIGHDPVLQQRALASYQTFRRLEEIELWAIDVLCTSSRVLGPLLWLRWLFLDGCLEPTTTIGQRIRKIVDGQPF